MPQVAARRRQGARRPACARPRRRGARAGSTRLVGTRQTVLIENGDKGHSDGFAPVRIAGAPRGDIGTALITGRDGDHLIGTFE